MKETEWDESVILDDAHLSTFTGGDPDFEKQILSIFLNNAPGYLDALHQTGVNEWRSTAHKLKGAARSIGAWCLAREAERAEFLGAPAEDDPKRARVLTELEIRLTALVAHIEERL